MSHLAQQIQALTQQVESLAVQVKELQAENQKLKQENSQLRDKIARLEKNSSNSSKPPSSDIVDPPPAPKKKKKRKIGGQKGHPKHTRRPFSQDEIDRTIIHTLPEEEIRRRGLIPLDETEVALQQVDLPEKMFDVIEHHVRLYKDPNGKVVKAKLPKHIRKAGFFSPKMMALTGYLKARGHMSYSTLQAFFNDVMNLEISQGFLTKVCTRKLSPALQPAYAEAAESLRNAPIVGTDETGHKNPAYKSSWTWCQQTPQAVFFHITPLQKVHKPPNHNEAWNIRDRFKGTGKKNYFLFLERDGVPPTNNGTEQAIRFVVIDRRVTQDTRSDAGMRFCERVWTVVATCDRHRRSVFQFFLDALQATLNPNLTYPALIPANL